VVGPIVLDHINNHGPASYRVGETAWLFPGTSARADHRDRSNQRSPRRHQYRQGRRMGQACCTQLERLRRQPHGPRLRPIRATTPARERADELDYRLCCMPPTMWISRTPSSTWAVPSATKPCLR
jgi:hypothetical protein